ncbi:MAG: hypothetical protein P4M07_19220 [Xanthobacteraceae bacterium]|nr:hypothetical protein [Xanthobacteraceae bacterium]
MIEVRGILPDRDHAGEAAQEHHGIRHAERLDRIARANGIIHHGDRHRPP